MLDKHNMTVYNVVMDTNFGHYICGFVDGEGYFGILKPSGSSIQYGTQFVVRLRSDDAEILHCIRRALGGLGDVIVHRPDKAGGKYVTWRVLRINDQVKLIDFFEQFPLRAKKKKDYEIWKLAVLEKSTKPPPERNLEYMQELYQKCKELK